MAAGRHIEICKNLNNSQTVSPILTKFGTELHLGTSTQTSDGSKPPFFKIQDGRRRKLKFTKNLITSKLFVLYATNLVRIIHFAPGTSLWSQNVEIHNPRWPPAAILKFAKNLNNARTVCPILTKFGTAQSFDLTPPRHRTGQTRHFSKSKMAADEKLKFTKKLNNLETVRPICTKFGIYHPLRTQNKSVIPKCRHS